MGADLRREPPRGHERLGADGPADRRLGLEGRPAVCIVVGASGAPALHWGIETAGFIVASTRPTSAQRPDREGSDAARSSTTA
jgi:hypothetical protein